VEEKTFRDDLFYRINTFVVKLPALRERTGDIRALANIFLESFSRNMEKSFLGIEEEVYGIFEKYSWPENIRELANVMDRAIAVAETPRISVYDLPPALQSIGLRQTGPGREGMIRELERDCLVGLLAETRGNLREVARRIGVARSTVYNKVKSFRIPIETYRG
jgi:transcriptional regulator with PAS, ATPase and Fis domain